MPPGSRRPPRPGPSPPPFLDLPPAKKKEVGGGEGDYEKAKEGKRTARSEKKGAPTPQFTPPPNRAFAARRGQ